MQLQEEPVPGERRLCWLVATDWINPQKCLKEMPSPSPTFIFFRISPYPLSEPIPWTMLGSWEDNRFLNSSVFRVGPLSAEAEWNFETSVSMAFSRSEYWERTEGKRRSSQVKAEQRVNGQPFCWSGTFLNFTLVRAFDLLNPSKT